MFFLVLDGPLQWPMRDAETPLKPEEDFRKFMKQYHLTKSVLLALSFVQEYLTLFAFIWVFLFKNDQSVNLESLDECRGELASKLQNLARRDLI